MLRIDVARRRTTVVYYDTQPSIGDVNRIHLDHRLLRCLRYADSMRFAHGRNVLTETQCTNRVQKVCNWIARAPRSDLIWCGIILTITFNPSIEKAAVTFYPTM
jgi:hypothetical protein